MSSAKHSEASERCWIHCRNSRETALAARFRGGRMRKASYTHASRRRAGRSRHPFVQRAIATLMAFTVASSIQPGRVRAQQVLDCGVNGFCLSGNLTNLLGLPNGTLNIIGYQPWDVIVHGPKPNSPFADEWSNAAAALGPIEADARATLAALHGVPNDFRIPHAAAS